MDGLNKEQTAYFDQMKAELEQAKLDADAARKGQEQAEADKDSLLNKIAKGKVALPVKGSYNGHGFEDGHHRIRDRDSKVCDAEKVLAAAAEGDKEAKAIMDWLIKIEYAHLVKLEQSGGKSGKKA